MKEEKKKYDFWIPDYLFDRIIIMAKSKNKSVPQMMNELTNIGYTYELGGKVKDHYCVKCNSEIKCKICDE